MRVLLLALEPIWLYIMFMLMADFLDICLPLYPKKQPWWGGSPLWAAGMLGLFIPATIAGVFGIGWLALHP